MANRTRVISQSKAVYVAPTGWTTTSSANTLVAAQLNGVDTFSFDIDLAGSRQDVREFGQLARIGTVRMTEINPTLSFGYYLGGGGNELALGFTESSSQQCIADILNEVATKRESNVFVLTAKEGEDAFEFESDGDDSNYTADETNHDVIGFGNAFLSSYSLNLSVGEIPRADVEMQASNVVFYNGIHSGLVPPSLNLDGTRAQPESNHTDFDANTNQYYANISLPRPSKSADLGSSLKVLKPHDVTVAFTYTQGGRTDFHGTDGIGGQKITSSLNAIQSLSIDLPLSREVIDAIGSQLAYAKPLEFPIDVTLSLSALVTEFQAGALEKALTGAAGDKDVTITVTLAAGSTNEIVVVLKKAVLDNQSFSMGLDDNETVDLTFSAQIGGASTTDQGLFFNSFDDSDPRATTATVEHNDGWSGRSSFTQPITH